MIKPELCTGMKKALPGWVLLFLGILFPIVVQASPLEATTVPEVLGIRIEFILFTLTLAGIAIFHHHTMYVALTGLVLLLLFKLFFDSSFNLLHHFIGGNNEEGEWRTILNLFGLLTGFAVLARHFEDSHIPEILPSFLPDGWKGGLVLLALILVISSFLDNIAAAIIGGTIAQTVYNRKVHIGFIAGIIAASNAGGAGSVVGDTTTTMMWIDGVNALDVTHAYVGSLAAFFIFGSIAAIQQHKYQPAIRRNAISVKPDWKRIAVVFMILAGAILANALLDFPAVGVWLAIMAGAVLAKIPWHEVKTSLKGTVFLLSLILCASLMPVNELPVASWLTALNLGFVSAVFDNIPLTKLCLEQGGYDWGILAFAVGFGGSMLWFGSSAGVALSNIFPEAKHTFNYLKSGWHVAIAYVMAFFIMLAVVGWHPHPPHKRKKEVKPEAFILNGQAHPCALQCSCNPTVWLSIS